MEQKDRQMTKPGAEWRKTYRMRLLGLAFVLILLGFLFGYLGTVSGTPALVITAYALWVTSCVLALLTKNK